MVKNWMYTQSFETIECAACGRNVEISLMTALNIKEQKEFNFRCCGTQSVNIDI